MKALQFINGSLQVSNLPRPDGGVEAVVRVVKSGICNTDLEIVRGYAGFQGTIGHEFVGVVEESPGSPEWTGKRVVGEINVGCGICELCVIGDARHCAERTVLGIHGRDGCHADLLRLPASNLLEIPAAVSDDEAVFAEPLAAAYGISEQVEMSPETKIAVIGDGKLGILCAMCAGLRSDNVTIIGKHKAKLAKAERDNIEGVLLDDISGKFKRQFDVVIEASGSESGFATAVDTVKPRGKIVLKSTFHGSPRWEASRVVVDEITIVGSRCGRFAPALELLANKKIRVDDLISEEFRLSDGIKAVERAGGKGVLKVLLRMDI
ncbi:MAG: alcohol dehydrogenase catalytic domain-containing protein [Saprospiraceae bacterium]|nr:alcohol dehydrogenase catalytic domain-containing protein [Pyrinomonadaceae bacterium]